MQRVTVLVPKPRWGRTSGVPELRPGHLTRALHQARRAPRAASAASNPDEVRNRLRTVTVIMHRERDVRPHRAVASS